MEKIKELLEKIYSWVKSQKWIPSWLKESNREKHLICSIPCGILGNFMFVLGLALGMEFKDKQWGGKWDWLDIAATCIGGFIGSLINTLLLVLIF